MKEVGVKGSEAYDFIIKTYANADVLKISSLGKEIKEASVRRNHAAHPGIITYQTAKEDKRVVYDDDAYTETIQIHNLFVELIRGLGIA